MGKNCRGILQESRKKVPSEKVTVFCAGGCGRSVTLRKSKVKKADFYLCGSSVDGQKCREALPPLEPGKMRQVILNAAASFWGYRDVWPDEDMKAGFERAKALVLAAMAANGEDISEAVCAIIDPLSGVICETRIENPDMEVDGAKIIQ